MGNPIQPNRPLDPDERRELVVEPVSKDKQIDQKNPMDRAAEIKDPVSLYTLYTNLLGKLSTIFITEEEQHKTISHDALVGLVQGLVDHLTILTKKESSENVDYATRLSEIWCSLIFATERFRLYPGETRINVGELIHILESIGNFPYFGDHLLGYYLKEHAGKDWLPFPFMELLKKIHTDYVYDPIRSDLAQWLHSLTAILKE